MLDVDWLGTWIQQTHLQKEAIQEYRRVFKARPTQHIVLEDFLIEKVARRLSQFLTLEAVYDQHYGLYSKPEHKATKEAWQQAADYDRFFKYDRLLDVDKAFQLSANLVTYLKFRSALLDPKFTAYFEELTGVSLGTSTIPRAVAMRKGDFLKTHDDNADDRRVAIVLYLSEDWQPGYGGALNLVGPDGNITKIEATFNNIVLFDVTSGFQHLISDIEPAVLEHARVTIGFWAHNRK